MKKGLTVLVVGMGMTLSLFASAWDMAYVGGGGLWGAAMGGAMVAAVDDASAVCWNPGALALGEGRSTVASLGIFLPHMTYNGLATGKEVASDKTIPMPALYYSQTLSDKLAAGLGVYTPYGGGGCWDKNDWGGLPQEGSVVVFTLAPVLSYRLAEKVGLGLGANLYYGMMPLEIGGLDFGSMGTVTFEDDEKGMGYGFSLGLKYQASDKLSVGLAGRSQAQMNLEGEATITPVGSPVGIAADTSSVFTLPSVFTGGMAYRLAEGVIVAAEGRYVTWEQLNAIDSSMTVSGVPTAIETSNSREMESTLSFSGGLEYSAAKPYALRLGLIYTPRAIPDKTVSHLNPDGDKIGVNGGVGYDSGDLAVRLVVTYIFTGEFDVPLNAENVLPGTYSISAMTVGAQGNYAF